MHIICGVPVSGNVMNEVVFWQIKRLLPALCDCCTVVEERHITSGPSEQPGYLLDSCYFFFLVLNLMYWWPIWGL